MSRIRILIETDEDNPVFGHCPDDDIAAEAIYTDWLTPFFGVVFYGAKIVKLEIEDSASSYNLSTREKGTLFDE